jgi:hypothetical protein
MTEERESYNAGDKKQIKDARKKERRRRRQQLEDLQAVLKTDEGQRVLWRFLKKCGVFESIWEPSARIHFKAGQQDLGHFMQGEILTADQEAYFEMMRKPKDEEGLIDG